MAAQRPAGPSLPGPPRGGDRAARAGGAFDGAVHEDQMGRPLYRATFLQAVKRFFRNYANFTGRASRSEYWWAQAFLVLVMVVPYVAMLVGFGPLIDAEGDMPVGFGFGVMALLAVGLAVVVPSLAITWRRLHDANHSGTYWLFGLIPYAGGVILLVFTLMRPNPAGRRFDRPVGY